MPPASIISRIAHKSCRASARQRPSQPWWQHLDPKFCTTDESFDLGWRDRAVVGSSAALDVAIRTAGAMVVGALAVPPGYHPRALRRAFADAPLYAIESGDSPQQFFPPPPAGVHIERGRPDWPHFKPPDGSCCTLSFHSPFRPKNPRIAGAYLANRRNQLARAQYWRHHQGCRHTIVAVHGFFADPYWVNEWFFALPWFYRMGCDVLLVTLPFHGRRQSALSPFSGYGLFAGGICRINEAFAQAVHDIRIFIDHLFNRAGATAVGVTGVSLGGYTTALLACVEPRLSFAIPNSPVVTIADLVLEWFPLNLGMRLALRLLDKSLADVRALMAGHCPLSYRPAIERRRLMIIGGIGDRLAPPKHTRVLWEHWDRPRLHWFPGSHVLHLDRGAYLKHMAGFLGSLEFIPPRSRR